jgi:tripartite-type tricarboxylate transporter receptor subunit TctC
MKESAASVAVLLLVGAASAPIAAQDYPSRPVRAITALVPGGLSDVFMRVAGEEFQKQLGQPIVVENRPGGSLNIGGRACAEAPPDGYTICILPVETLSYNKFLFKKLAFDPEKDFAPITNLFFVTQVLAVNAAMKVRTLDELAALSKAKPGTLSYVAPSVPLSLFMDKFKQSSGADMVKVPYRGGGDAVNGILSGATPIAFLGLANVISHLRAGTMTALAIDSEHRSPLLPDVPTLRELGYRGDITQVYFGLVAPAGTPAPIIARLNQEFVRIGTMPAFRSKNMVDLGLEPILDQPDDFARYLKENRVVAERIVKEAGLEPQ